MPKTYTPPSPSLEPLMTHEAIDRMVAASVQRFNDDAEAAKRAAEPSIDAQIRQRLDQAKFKELVADVAINSGVIPRAVKHVVREAATIFELRDGQLLATEGRTDPADPLVPLSVTRWLEQLRTTDAFLFVTS
jgi:hypothetical protein